uniref:Uncharacterized protein n=1 Tax=Strongyloides venezuelensis TaxID=75913 RepID=A0A0K0G684_STRVS
MLVYDSFTGTIESSFFKISIRTCLKCECICDAFLCLCNILFASLPQNVKIGYGLILLFRVIASILSLINKKKVYITLHQFIEMFNINFCFFAILIDQFTITKLFFNCSDILLSILKLSFDEKVKSYYTNSIQGITTISKSVVLKYGESKESYA